MFFFLFRGKGLVEIFISGSSQKMDKEERELGWSHKVTGLFESLTVYMIGQGHAFWDRPPPDTPGVDEMCLPALPAFLCRLEKESTRRRGMKTLRKVSKVRSNELTNVRGLLELDALWLADSFEAQHPMMFRLSESFSLSGCEWRLQHGRRKVACKTCASTSSQKKGAAPILDSTKAWLNHVCKVHSVRIMMG